MTKLNLGCGYSKISGAVNVDSNPQCHPDVTFDICETFPLGSSLFDEVYFFHTIEHIQKRYHRSVFLEINRVMKEGGKLFLSFPEFSKVALHWLQNFLGKREFWEATIFGRQLGPGDFHVCAMDSDELKQTLEECGFYDLRFRPEFNESYNTLVYGVRTIPQKMYAEILYDEVLGVGEGREYEKDFEIGSPGNFEHSTLGTECLHSE